jgi:hypothetical protein
MNFGSLVMSGNILATSSFSWTMWSLNSYKVMHVAPSSAYSSLKSYKIHCLETRWIFHPRENSSNMPSAWREHHNHSVNWMLIFYESRSRSKAWQGLLASNMQQAI